MSRILSFSDNHLPPSLLVNVKGVLTTKQFEQLCRVNRDLRLELTSTGELAAMPPTGSKMGIRNANLTYQLAAWALVDASGFTFDSSTGFALPNGARFSPDAAWVKKGKWQRLTEEEQEGFAPLCPDFVVEIRSRDDNDPPLQDKMLEYIENGASLGWLIDPLKRRVYVYAPRADVLILNNPESVSGEPLLSGFSLLMDQIW